MSECMSSAKEMLPGETNVAYICSRYYRAPELILGATDYTILIGMSAIFHLQLLITEKLISVSYMLHGQRFCFSFLFIFFVRHV